MDKAGNIYGTTEAGGAINGGIVFKLDPSGTESVLHDFTGPPDGFQPTAGLIIDAAGNLYGTTFQGGSGNNGIDFNNGIVFELAPSGTGTVLHNFNGSPDGATPAAGLLMDAAGNLFGATSTGGSYNQGTVFKLTLPVTYASLINLVNTFVIKPRVTSSMVAKLQGAEAAAAKGDNAVANRKLAAFIHEVSAQSGKSLTTIHAATLEQQAQTLEM